MTDPDDLPAIANASAQAFEAAGDRIAAALERAATTGELSFNRMAESILSDLARIAVDEVVTGLLGGLGAGGGSGGGQGGGPVTVNMNVSGATSPQAFSRSRNQIATQLTRAVSQGRRYI